MKIVNDSIKNALKQKTTQRKGRILVNGTYYEVYNVEYYADVYNEGNVIGNAIASQLDFDIPYMNKFNEFKYFDGVWTGLGYEYVDMGTFTVFDEKDEDEFTKHITAFDNLIKFNIPFKDDKKYPKTLFQELQNVCNQAGVELENTSIANGDFIIENNQFVGGENLKSVLKAICGVSGNYATIKNDKLVLQLYNSTNESITKSEHSPVNWKRKTYGINQVVLGMENVEGEYVLKQDDDDIAKNGVHKLVINDNFFAYTQDKRQQLIDGLFEKVKGFGYIPYDLKTEWLSYLDVGDTINIDGIDTIVLRINGKSPNALESEMSAPAIIDSAIEFVDNTETLKKVQKRTTIEVDKNAGNIINLTTNITNIQDNLNNNYYTIEQSNQLIQNAETGVTNTFSEAGGNNIFRNTGLWFENEGTLVKENKFKNNEIEIKNGLEKPVQELRVYGKSEQKTRSGKNILYVVPETMTGNGLTVIKNVDGSIKINGTAIDNSYFNINISKTDEKNLFTLEKGKYYTSYLKNNVLGMNIVTRTKEQNKPLLSTPNGQQIYIHQYNGETDEGAFAFLYIRKGSTYNNLTVYPMIVEGQYTLDTIGDFEPYGAMPSPEYPSEIKSLPSIENIFDKDNYLTIDGFINASTHTIQASTNGQKSAYVKVKPNTQYYISDFAFKVALEVGSFTNIPKIGDLATNHVVKKINTTDLTITTGANDNYLVFMISNATSTTDTSRMQITEGSKRKPYVPFGHWLQIKNIGKNLINVQPYTTNSTGNTVHYISMDIVTQLETGGKYIIQGKCSDGTLLTSRNTAFVIMNDNKQLINWNPSSTVVRTLNVDLSDARSCYIYTNDVLAGKEITEFQIEKYKGDNSLGTDYEPYKETITLVDMNKYDESGNINGHYELSSIGDTKDELEVISGKGIKKINEIVLDGSEDWVRLSNGLFFLRGTGYLTYSNGGKCYSSHFKGSVYGSIDNNKEMWIGNSNFINVRWNEVTSLDEFKAKLQEQYNAGTPVTVKYILETPEEFTLKPTPMNTRHGFNDIKLIEDLITDVSIKYEQGGNYEFWNGSVLKSSNDKSSNSTALLLQNGILSQEQIVPNGNYTVSFKYKKLIDLAECKVKINEREYLLSETTDTEFVTGKKNAEGDYITQPLQIESNHINVQFISDTDNSCEIYDLMVNAGTVKLAYSQNQNETTTDTVNISKGITIISSNKNVKFKADADGIRVYEKNAKETDDPLVKFTDTGMSTKKQIVENEAEIVSVLIQKVGNQTWFTKI